MRPAWPRSNTRRFWPSRACPGSESTIGELAERLQIRHHSAVGLADRLAAKNLVRRRPNPGDRRQAYLTLTRQGEELLEKLSAAHKEQLRRIGPEIQSLLERLRGPGSKND